MRTGAPNALITLGRYVRLRLDFFMAADAAVAELTRRKAASTGGTLKTASDEFSTGWD